MPLAQAAAAAGLAMLAAPLAAQTGPSAPAGPTLTLSAEGTASAAPDAAEITFEQRIAYPGFETSPDVPAVSLVRSMRGANDDMKVSYGTEAGFLASLGLTCAVIGPGEMTRDGHRPDEGLDIAQLEACDRFLEGVCQRLL